MFDSDARRIRKACQDLDTIHREHGITTLAVKHITKAVDAITTTHMTADAYTDDMWNELSQLNPRERTIICLRYGLTAPPHTLAQIAHTLGITTERTRQLEARTIARITHPTSGLPLLRRYLTT